MTPAATERARADVRLPSTRHLVCTEEDAVFFGRAIGVDADIAILSFKGEPVRMVLEVSKHLARKYDATDEVLEWAQKQCRGAHNPDPARYQRNADVVPLQ